MSFTEALANQSNVGLTSGEAAALLERWGKNSFGKKAKSHWLKSILDRLRNPLVCILLAAGFISALTGETGSFAIILMVVSISIAMDICQQRKADDAVERLSASVALSARVLRDGHEVRVPSDSIVPGDVVLLSAGDLIPADGVLLEAKHLFVDQSSLSGESYPVEKVVSVSSNLENAAQSSDLSSETKCFAGSSVSSGTAKLLISATGLRTVFGELSLSLAQQRSATSFDRELQSFGNLILRFTIVLVVFAFVINISFHRPLLESLLFSVALAVGLTPELLPMIVTVTLARGALLMAKEKVIVKRLSAVQDLGSMDVLCTDKTGTLTEGKIELFKHIDLDGKSCDEVLRFAYLNSANETGIKSPLDDAIMRAFQDRGEKALYHKIDEVPFDFERRRVSVLLEQNDRQFLCVKGAVEEVVSVCSDCKVGGRLYPISEYRTRINDLFSELASSGFHILAVACRVNSERLSGLTVADEEKLTFLGFAAFLDPPKQSASAALRALKDDGVDVKILSGDHELVARYVCNELQFTVTGSLTGADLDALDDASLSLKIDQVNLFCRVNPSQKNRIIILLRGRDKIVGFLGDGINDAPSLHAADVGVSVDSAVDVAKQAADLVLLEHDLRVLHAGIREGRRAFSNVHKYIMMATSSNFGNMVSMAAASLILPFLPLLPFQILLNNLLYDLSELALPTDNVDEELLAKPCRESMSSIQKFMLSVGPISSIFDFITFFLLLAVLKADQTLFRSGWFIESLATQILVIFVIRTRRKFWLSTPSAPLAIASVATLIVACLLTQTRLGALLQFTALPLSFFIMLGIIAVIYLAIVAVVSTRFYARGSLR
ncbi:MAG: magnesium-translocating P-type ATPase [Candidatus Melainabacteria bacterium]|nr:MAG: magnesium-translocating P-type ATPase [Candidatus Melainabacteria bacterium]